MKGLPRSLRRATIGGGLRPQLAADLTIYVDPAGSDGAEGLLDDPFKTIGRAITAMYALDLNGFNGTIKVAAGTYGEIVSVNRPFVGGLVTLLGDIAAPATYIVSTSNSSGVFQVIGAGASISINGIRCINSGGGDLFQASELGLIKLNAVECGAAGAAHLRATHGGQIRAVTNYSVVGAGTRHYYAEAGALIRCGNRTVTITGTPAFSVGFATCRSSRIDAPSMTFSGSATGVRHVIEGAGSIWINGASAATYFPGDQAGTVATGSNIS